MLERQQQQQQEMEEEGTQQKPSHSTTCPFDDCTILIPDEKLLDGHIFMHNALTTRPPYPCFEEECSSFFDTKSGILAHALTHKK
ncbi:hypothetical protein BC939DRAFT_439296 [Gamsiella multidivaricata]|uniref:uncharacterized protein n=1 Tax=Gamsiella multidivaricata TaxID=101098 RepID=UPI00222099C5|nr:uncharacterized protein BC939DRAFT_439296 [Gamsiella multidivaricata]KAI7830432.1 hypothetical protein BC939DRAFT_439296 [Gamsiella multidivaricata]